MQDSILQALGNNDLDQALTLARQWLADEPGSLQAASALVAVLRRNGNNDEALAVVDQALQQHPDEAGLHLQRATLLLGMRALDQAEQSLQQTIALDPNSFESYVIKANLALLRGELDEAESLARLAARVQAEHPQLDAVNGMIALHRNDADRALSLLSAAARVTPDDPRLSYGLGFALMAKGHLAFAEQAFRRVLGHQPQALPIIGLVADLCLRQGNAEGALEMVERMLAAPGGDALPVRRVAAQMLLQLGQPQRALEQALAVQAGQPGERASLQVLLMACERLDAADQARATLDELLQGNPQVHPLWLARLAVEAVGSDAAVAVAERWLAAMPSHLPALETRMRLHDMKEQPEQALELARQIIALDPMRVSGHRRLVAGLLETAPDQAVAHVRGLVQTAPEQSRNELRGWLALVLDRAGQQAEAVEQWLQLRQEEAPQRLPLPPQAKSPGSWPDMGPIDESLARPLFVWGAPGSAVEQVVAALEGISAVVRTDRFGANPPADPFQRYDTLQALATDELTGEALVQQWRDALPARGIPDGNVIDWLLWWDNAFLWAMRPQLPEGRLMVVLRDPRDMLLDWLAFGGTLPVAFNAVGEAADWLMRSMEQVARLKEQSLYPVAVVRIDGAEGDTRAMGELLASAFGMETFPAIPALPKPRLPAGHWRHYRDVLGAAFNNLTPVAVRLGYPEN